MLSPGQKQCQRQKEAVGGLDATSRGCWGSYMPPRDSDCQRLTLTSNLSVKAVSVLWLSISEVGFCASRLWPVPTKQ